MLKQLRSFVAGTLTELEAGRDQRQLKKGWCYRTQEKLLCDSHGFVVYFAWGESVARMCFVAEFCL